MKIVIKANSFAELRERKLARARRLDRKERVPSEKRITFATADQMLLHITPRRVRLCEVAREKPRSITELAAVLQRDRKAVHRDVQALHSVGMLLLRKEPNPGHGQVQVVMAAAGRFQLVAEV
jgi:predicted transcriptional regulator